MKKGWVRLHRDIDDNFLWLLEPFSKGQAWVDLFLNANHSDNTISIRGNIIKVKRGQIAWSEITMSKRWQWSRKKVRNFLKLLRSEQQIVQQTVFRITTITTILNYESYQSEQQNGQQKNNRGYTNKKEKKEKKETPLPPQGEVLEILEYFKEHAECKIAFNAEKKKKVVARLKSFNAEELKQAILNRSSSAFMKGDNPSRVNYAKDFGSLFRNDEQIEKWLNRKKINPMDNV